MKRCEINTGLNVEELLLKIGHETKRNLSIK